VALLLKLIGLTKISETTRLRDIAEIPLLLEGKKEF
jgi:hypothetical protein